MNENHLVDDNDLANLVIRKIIKTDEENKYKAKDEQINIKYDAIIVDEVQDLTDRQLDAIIKASSNKQKIYFFGDQNQSINPTLFDVETIRGCLMHNLSNDDIVEPEEMTISYRFGPQLSIYINNLIRIRRDLIGATGVLEIENSALDEETYRYAGYSLDKKVNDIVIKTAINNARAMIIVPDEIVKNKLIKQYSETISDHIMTIYDSKGLEWNYVVLYGMISFFKEEYKQILDGQAKHSTLHRMIFNQYYVGCTRSHVCFCVLEDDLDNEIIDKLLPTKANTNGQSDFKINADNVDIYIKEDNSSESWFLEGKQRFEQGEYGLALSRFNIAKNDVDKKMYLDICQIMLSEEKQTYSTAELCRKEKFYREARIIYKKLGYGDESYLMGLHCRQDLYEENRVDELIKKLTLTFEDLKLIESFGYFELKIKRMNTTFDKLIKSMEE